MVGGLSEKTSLAGGGRDVGREQVSGEDDAGPSWWEQVWTRSAQIGAIGTVNMIAWKTIRPLVRSWKRWRVCHAAQAGPGTNEIVRVFARPGEDIDHLTARFRQKLRSSLPVGPDDAAAIVECLERSAPDAKAQIVESADRVCAHVFDLLGSGPVALGRPIDWHADFKSGYRWDPTVPYLDVPFGHVAGVDIKVPWELSRGQHLPLLAQASWISGDTRYTEELVAQIQHWVQENPVGYGVNWSCPMDVAIRAVNWLWGVGLAVNSSAVTNEFLTTVLASLLSHGRHVFENLEIRNDGITTNHYLADLVGLLFLGLCLPESQETDHWRRFALQELTKEMDAQVLLDGVHYESSLSYHRLVTEMFLSSAALCRQHDQALPQPFWSRLERMCEFVAAYTKPNGLAPQIGDGDNGRLHILSGYGTSDTRDHRHLIAVGAILFERADWWASTGPLWIEGLWFGGSQLPRWQQPTSLGSLMPKSSAFPDGGFYIMRQNKDYVLYNCNPVGTKGIGTHKHNDLLSLEVHLGGEDLIVDPGSFLYTSNPEAYNSARSTTVHSTVMVDGAEQNRFLPNKLFVLHADARLKVLSWESDHGCDSISAELNGYTRVKDLVTHRRTVTFTGDTGQVEILDHFSDPVGRSASHKLIWTFPFAPGCVVEPDKDGWIITAPRQHVRLSAPYCDLMGQALSIDSKIEQGWVSVGYGVREQAPILRWRWEGAIPLTVRFMLSRN